MYRRNVSSEHPTTDEGWIRDEGSSQLFPLETVQWGAFVERAIHSSRVDRAGPSLPLGMILDAVDDLPGAVLFLKDSELRYVASSRAMATFCGVAHPWQLEGRCGRDFFLDSTWQQEQALERQVLTVRRPLKNRLKLSLRLHRPPIWNVFSYWPLFGYSSPKSVGVMGIGRVLARLDERNNTYQAVAKAVHEVHANFREVIDVPEIARRCGLSARQLDYYFIRLFGAPLGKYLTKVRLDAAIEMLGHKTSIASIAHSCGYTDQSAFTRRFRAVVGMSPTQYRARLTSRQKT